MKRLLDEYKALKNQTQYLKMILANIINRLGDSIDAIAFTWLVFELTHSPAWSTIIFGVNMLPSIFLQPFCGALVERMNKKTIMICSDLARGVAVCGIAYCYYIGILTPWHLLAVTIFNSSVEAMRVPAGTAIVPKLLGKEYYDTGIALNASLSRVFELIGTGCAGIFIALIGVSGAIIIDSITFVISAIIISCIPYKDEIHKIKIDVSSYLVTLKEGFHYIRTTKVIIILCITGSLINMMVVPLNSFLPAYIDEVLKAGSEMLSGINMSITFGMVLGSLAYPLLSKKVSKRWMLLSTTIFMGILYIGLIYIPLWIPSLFLSNALILLLNFFLGSMVAMLNTATAILMVSSVKQYFLARVSAVSGAAMMAMIPVSSFLITIILQFMEFTSILVGFGILTLVFGILLIKVKSLYLLDKSEESYDIL